MFIEKPRLSVLDSAAFSIFLMVQKLGGSSQKSQVVQPWRTQVPGPRPPLLGG